MLGGLEYMTMVINDFVFVWLQFWGFFYILFGLNFPNSSTVILRLINYDPVWFELYKRKTRKIFCSLKFIMLIQRNRLKLIQTQWGNVFNWEYCRVRVGL